MFRTGASGYIGGQALHSISAALPDLSIRALVRDAAKAKTIAAAFPKVQVVEGSLDDSALITQEAKEADVILRETFFPGHFENVWLTELSRFGRYQASGECAGAS